mmetsp:Transcript_29047/g.43890  ORF Transcript_29047/g.43890 Transcript_29047/m.43890 type:complete len:102 (+) Transcript_29047:24-329(+)
MFLYNVTKCVSFDFPLSFKPKEWYFQRKERNSNTTKEACFLFLISSSEYLFPEHLFKRSSYKYYFVVYNTWNSAVRKLIVQFLVASRKQLSPGVPKYPAVS